MSNLIKGLRIIAANLIWFLSCLPSMISFSISLRQVRPAQERIFKRILAPAKFSRFGIENNFNQMTTVDQYSNIPIRNYDDFEPYIQMIINGEPQVLSNESVRLLQPTSGSTSGTKLIPYTEPLKREFQAAINPWIGNLYLIRPALFCGSHYWAISPQTTRVAQQHDGSPRIGFEDDTDYLNLLQRWISNTLFPVPADVRDIGDQSAWEYCTLLFLIRCRNLALISIWHPSYLIILMEKLKVYLSSCIEDIRCGSIDRTYQIDDQVYQKLTRTMRPDVRRAAELSRLNPEDDHLYEQIWPNLGLISCWTDGQASYVVPRLSRMFPKAWIQPKGLIATEGIITIPWGRRFLRVAAVRSHFYEFIDRNDGTVKRLWELERNSEYNVILTTGGGLYRYRLNDIVRVEEYLAKTPCLVFLSRDGVVSDWVGEKLDGYHIAKIVNDIGSELSLRFDFFMLAPVVDDDRVGYAIFMKPTAKCIDDQQQIVEFVEERLCENFHYLHARNISQLSRLRIYVITSPQPYQDYVDFYLQSGMKRGDIKQFMLEKRAGWEKVFKGYFIG